MNTKPLIGLILLLQLTACGSQSTQPDQNLSPYEAEQKEAERRTKNDSREKELLAEYKKSPKNISLTYEIAQFYRDRFASYNNKNDALESKQYLEKVLAARPASTDANYLLYDLDFILYSRSHDLDLNRLEARYLSLPQELRQQLASPELAQAYYLQKFQKQDTKTLRGLMSTSIKRSPFNANSYVALAETWLIEGKYTPSLAILNQGIRKIPEDIQLRSALAQVFMRQASATHCGSYDEQPLEKAIKHLNISKKLDPQNTLTRSLLFEVYFLLRKYPLAINEARYSYYKIAPTAQALKNLANVYSINEQYQKSRDLLNEHQKRASDLLEAFLSSEGKGANLDSYLTYYVPEEQIARLNILNGDWDKAYQLLKSHKFDASNHDIADNYALTHITSNRAGKVWQPRRSVLKEIKYKETSLPYWVREYEYKMRLSHAKTNILDGAIEPDSPLYSILSSNNLTDSLEEQILSLANERCSKTNFYTDVGFRYLYNEDFGKAKKYLQLAIDQNSPTQFKHTLAKHLLNSIPKTAEENK